MEAQFARPYDLAVSADGTVLYVADGANGACGQERQEEFDLIDSSCLICGAHTMSSEAGFHGILRGCAGRLRAILLQEDSLGKSTAGDVGTIAGAAATMEARRAARSTAHCCCCWLAGWLLLTQMASLRSTAAPPQELHRPRLPYPTALSLDPEGKKARQPWQSSLVSLKAATGPLRLCGMGGGEQLRCPRAGVRCCARRALGLRCDRPCGGDLRSRGAASGRVGIGDEEEGRGASAHPPPAP